MWIISMSKAASLEFEDMENSCNAVAECSRHPKAATSEYIKQEINAEVTTEIDSAAEGILP